MAGTCSATTFSPSVTALCALHHRHASHSTSSLSLPGSPQSSVFFGKKKSPQHHIFLSVVVAVTQGSAESSKSDEKIPSWAKPDSSEPPPWARDDEPNKNGSSPPPPQQGIEFPFYVYLLASAITAIAAIGSIFEYVNQKPVFGVLSSDSIFYAPVLGFFAITGIPTSGFLWYKSVQSANKEAEEQDKRDGYF